MSVCRDISKCCEEVQEKHKLFMAECKKEGLDVVGNDKDSLVFRIGGLV